MHVETARVRNASSRQRAAPARALRCLACAAIGFALASSAAAEVFKCIDASGRVLYSDAPCPGGSHGEVIPMTDNAPAPAAKAPAPERDATPAGAAPPAPPPQPAGGRYDLSVNERQRVANLEQVQRSADNGEKREAARMEIREIQRGTLARMSYEDLRKKDAYWVDLGNPDAGKRQAAVQQLAALFAAYR